MQYLLSWIIFTPMIFALVAAITPQAFEGKLRSLTLIQTLVNAFLAVILYMNFDGYSDSGQFVQIMEWLPEWGLRYIVSVDGISLPLVMLTAFVSPLALLGTWPQAGALKKEKFFVIMLMALQTGMYGTFFAADLFLFYFFWEVVLIPMFFMIGIWGGKDRIYATVKFFLYTMVGSLLMLVAIFWLIKTTGVSGQPSAAYADVAHLKFAFDSTSLWTAIKSPQSLLFLAFALAFVIKVPMVPFHTWLPDAHVQAPTVGSVFLAAVLLKLGTYGLMRIAIPFFPQAAHYFSTFFITMGVIGIIYGAFCALAQTDFKKLVAYSSVSHMGYIVVGLFSFNKVAIAGSLYQMINHGISAGGLFMIVGFLYERLHTRNLEEFGGLAKTVPVMAIAFMIMTLSSVAIPGSNGFVGEFTILLGSFQTHPMFALFAGTGVIFGAIYALKAYQMVMLGPTTRTDLDHLHDMDTREVIAMVVLAVFVFGIGFFPKTFFWKSDASLESYANSLITTVGQL